MIKGLHHVGIVTDDIEKAKRFYCGVFGLTVFSESAWSEDNDTFNAIIGMRGSAARFCMLRGPNCYLELFEYSSPASSEDPRLRQASDRGLRHIMFEVDDVGAAWNKVRELGGIVMNEPVSVPGGPTVIYCRDPFGNLLELAQPAGRMPSLEDLGR